MKMFDIESWLEKIQENGPVAETITRLKEQEDSAEKQEGR